MFQTRKLLAFTLIELLVVIAIISMIAALVSQSLFKARVSARNARAQDDVVAIDKSIQSYSINDATSEQIISNIVGNGPDTLHNPVISSDHLQDIFTGNYRSSSPYSYDVSIKNTPGAGYVYNYNDLYASTNTGIRVLTTLNQGFTTSICTTLVNSSTIYTCIRNNSLYQTNFNPGTLVNMNIQVTSNLQPLACAHVPHFLLTGGLFSIFPILDYGNAGTNIPAVGTPTPISASVTLDSGSPYVLSPSPYSASAILNPNTYAVDVTLTPYVTYNGSAICSP